MSEQAAQGPARVDHGAAVAALHGISRSPHWPAVEKAFAAAHTTCLFGPHKDFPKAKNQIHHTKVPFHLAILCGRGDLELDFRNLSALCQNEQGFASADCHIKWGHLESFRSWNPNLFEDAKIYGGDKQMIYSSTIYSDRVKNRPDPDKAETHDELARLRAWLDTELPPDPQLCAKYGIVITPYV